MQQPLPPSPSVSGQHWEGEGTLHSYCYDYMRKRGWTETASAFAADAGINEEEWKGPPIEAPQGLLYEWWSVFWDVFIARSQSTGKRNIMADTYVESMRSKRDPLVVQFAGLPQSHSIALPRSLAHPPRIPSGQPGPSPRPSYTNPGQLHVLQQQQLQEQLQQGRAGPPMPGQQQQQQQQQQRNGPPPPGQYHPQASTSQGSPYIQPGRPLPQQSPYAQPHPGQPYQQQQHPSRPPSAQASPHLANTPHPYANGRPPSQGMMGGPRPPDPMGAAFAQSLAAVGLAGREPESLNPEEQAAVTAQMRRIGALPPLSAQGQQQQLLYRPQQARPPPQRLNPDQQRMQAQQQYVQQQQQQQQLQQGQQSSPQSAQQQQQFLIQQQQHQMMQQHHAQQQRMQQIGRQDTAYLPPGMQHSSSQVGSPSSPAYSSAPSPYATPLQTHPAPLGAQGLQGSPSGSAFNAPLPPPSRVVVKSRTSTAAASARMSPANSKRSVEDPSPRTRKRQRGAKDDDNMNGGETPRLDQSGPPSPANGGNPYAPMTGQSYRPSQSPVQHDGTLLLDGHPTRLSAQQIQNADFARQAQVAEARQQALDHMNSGASGAGPGHDELSGMIQSDSIKMNGSGPTSRPGSSASYGQAKHSPAMSPHAGAHGALDLPLHLNQHSTGPSHPQYAGQHGPPALHISIPPMPPPSAASFQLQNGNDMTPGGRPFAGAHPSSLGMNAMAMSSNGDGGLHQSDGSMPPPPQPGFEYPPTGGDPFSDLTGLDFQFDAFLEMGAFKEDESGENSLSTVG